MDRALIEGTIRRHHHEKQSIRAILMDLQDQGLPLNREVLQIVADQVEVPLARVFGLATFYDAFDLDKPGIPPLCVCQGLACSLKGGEALHDRIASVLNHPPNDSPADPAYYVKRVSCLGCCAIGPNVMIHERVYADPDPEEIINRLKPDRKGGGL
jgi:NADH:ubiquinone oxidoreductase subunit E